MSKEELARIMHVAYVLHDNKPSFPFKDCLRLAWYHWYFRRALQNGICRFSYYKGKPNDFDGSQEIRAAVGTLNMDLIPLDKRPGASSRQTEEVRDRSAEKGSTPKPSYTACAYFDLEKGEWRSYRYVDFIGYVTFLELKEGFFISQKRKEAKEKTMQSF